MFLTKAKKRIDKIAFCLYYIICCMINKKCLLLPTLIFTIYLLKKFIYLFVHSTTASICSKFNLLLNSFRKILKPYSLNLFFFHKDVT